MTAKKLPEGATVDFATGRLQLLCQRLGFCEHIVGNGYGDFHTASITIPMFGVKKFEVRVRSAPLYGAAGFPNVARIGLLIRWCLIEKTETLANSMSYRPAPPTFKHLFAIPTRRSSAESVGRGDQG